jgi:hypothetical protein
MSHGAVRRVALAIGLALGTAAAGSAAVRDDVHLVNASGMATAYIADDLTIYLWSGEPVAYLHDDRLQGGLDVYGFNGKHLGWLIAGVLHDHRGEAVGAFAEVFADTAQAATPKSTKNTKPMQSLKGAAPVRPRLSTAWSELTLMQFLLRGTND